MTGWEPVVGLEIHVQLKTRTKMFCSCANVWGRPENTLTCPVCLAHPGTLPVPNRNALEWTIKLGLALGCEIADRALFHRKNYFYPDLPKGYQISQYDEPLCARGRFLVPGSDGDREVGIVRAHLEEDAAKTVHVGGAAGRIAGAARSLVDFNRGGAPLVEIVTEPDIHSPEEARRFLQLLRQTVIELGISDAEMERGSLRCDANVSVRPVGDGGLRTKTELKNMNSFKFVADGIAAEVERQVGVYERGGEVVQETLHFDPATGVLSPLRTKEEAHDYRYFPEPDLVPVEPSRELVARLRAEIPELPAARIRRFESRYSLPLYDSEVLNASPALAGLFERLMAAGAEPKAASNVLMNQFAATGVDPASVNATELAQLIRERERIPRGTFAEALAASGEPGFSAEEHLREAAIADASELDPVIERILAANATEVAAYRSGKQGLLGYFVGQVMRETKGKANPRIVNERLRERLNA
ncbi:MAG: Asp-tRNA(Asn)/Glu-tRNA(Gln) amidotransferase subunit GatB [Actinomycetota bacterium]|nr:Asp-tRNA(Asn)/Glu-tRNA(Gln) amidotransferase subunit GatB [Actinomycetota bacterium]